MANWRRDVRLVVPPGSGVSQRLIIGETVNPPGNWSGIAPHKHDQTNDCENSLEEVYWFKVKPTDSFGVQLGYKGGMEESLFVHNDDVISDAEWISPNCCSPRYNSVLLLGSFW